MAGQRIKGITIEIGGDTTKLTQALKNVDATSKSLQTDLKDINRLLKLDPGNVELLKQKQSALAQSIDNTKQKLETLKTAEEQAAKQLESGEIGQKQFDSLKREIISTEQELKNLQKEYKNLNGGNVNKLEQALKKVDITSKSLQTDLKDINRLLKLDPGNVELLKQKQSALAQSIDNTKQKLETLKTAQEQAAQQLASGEIGQKQFDALQREIISTEQELKNLQKEYKNLNPTLQSAQAKTEAFGKSAKNLGNTFKPVSAAAAAVGTAAVASFKNVKEGYDQIIKKTGATGEAAKDLKNSFDNVFTGNVSDAGDVGAALGELNTRFGLTGEALETASKKFLAFARINETDVGQSVQLVSRAMANANIPAEEYGDMLDYLTVASQKSGIDTNTLTEDVTKYGAQLRALGIDTKTSIGMLAQFEKNGTNTSVVLTGLKTAVKNWALAGKDAKTEFPAVIEQIQNMQDPTEAAALAMSVFGNKAGQELVDSIQNGRFEISDMMTALDGCGGTVDNTAAEMSSGLGAATTATHTAMVALSDLGSSIMSVLGPILQSLANKIKNVTDWFNNLPSGVQTTIAIILILVAVIAPLLMIIGSIATGISALIPVVSGITAAFGALNAVLLANPIILIIVAIIALIAIFAVLWNKCEGFRNFWIGLWNTITGALSAAWNKISEFFSGIFQWFKELPGKMVDVGKNIIYKLWEGLVAVKDWIVDKVTGFFKNIFGGIGKLFGFGKNDSGGNGGESDVETYSVTPMMASIDEPDDVPVPKSSPVSLMRSIPRAITQMQNSMGDVVAKMSGVVAPPSDKYNLLAQAAPVQNNTQTYNQNVTINSPDPVSPAETARLNRIQMRRLIAGVR